MYNVAALLSRREELLQIIFEDCVSKDSYLSSISSLVLQDLLSSNENVSWEESNIPSPQKWLSMMLERSRLLFVLKATCDLDEDIQRALASQRHWHFLYQFESMMDVLIAASVFRNGTMELIDNNCISQHLSQLKCLTSRVFWTMYSSTSNTLNNNSRNNQNNNNNENILNIDNNNLSMECSRYLQLLTPCLRLINSMFAACPKNIRLHYQTLTFFQKHNDIIDKLLTLDNNEFVVLRSVKLILSIWYQLYYGPLYICNPQQLSNISARDSSILEHIEAKLPYFYFLIKKFKDIAFKQEYFQNDIDNDFDDDMMNNTSMYNETIYSQTKGETKETVSREIIRILINIFRLKAIGSSTKNNKNNSLSSNNEWKINPIFGKDLNTNQRQPEQAPNLKLLCDCLKGILPISKQTGKWIYEQNEELRRGSLNNNSSILAKLQTIEPILSTVSTDINLQCFLIENILVLLYFHCKHYLDEASPSLATDFYHKFSSVVMSEVIVSLKEWYEDENTCILHVDQDMIEKKWSSGLPIPSSSKRFIEMMIHKFYDLQRDKASGPLSITN